MRNIRISYSVSSVPQSYADELQTAFSALGHHVEWVENVKFRNPLRVLAYQYPRSRDYVFSPYSALESEIDTAPREIDVMFGGRLSDPYKMKDTWHALSGRIYKLCLMVAEILEHSQRTFDEALDEALLEIGCLSELPDHAFVYLVNQINMFTASLHGYNMLKVLLNAGIKVVYCNARSYCSLYRNPNLMIEKTQRIPKILLYAHPFLAYGASQTLLTAMGGGTVCVTDANGFMNDHFPEMILYGKGDLAERVTQLLEHPADLAELGCAAREKVLCKHMPRHRAERILLALELSGHTEVSLYE